MGRGEKELELSEELAGFLQSGISVNIATRDEAMTPNGTRAWAVVFDPDRRHVTAFVTAATAEPLLRDLESNGQVALGFDRPSTNRACQIKGRFLGSRRCRPAERAEIERQFGGFLADLASIGYPPEMFAGWKRWPAVAVKLRVTDVFHQTPGPGAGERLR